jgi:DNA-binding response OmpR family regulator
VHVLILDDNLMTSSAVQSQLWTHGHTASVVGSPAHALEVLRMEAPLLAIVNLVARSFDAIDAIRSVRAAAPERIRLLAFCGHTDQDRRARAYAAGADLVITNSQALKQLNDVLRDVTSPPAAG